MKIFLQIDPKSKTDELKPVFYALANNNVVKFKDIQSILQKIEQENEQAN